MNKPSHLDPNRSAIALDIGEKRIGVAVANLGVRFASPLTTLENPKTFLKDISKICKQEDAGLVVIGLPRGMQGQETAQTARVQEFGRHLAEQLGVDGHQLPLYWIDEALTSAAAEGELRAKAKGRLPFEKAKVDALAATYILDDFLKEFHG